MTATRTESDSMGTIEVPADRYWGAQTQRSLENFPIGVERMPEPLIRAFGIQKKAAALVNRVLGDLEPDVGDAIVKAAEEVAGGQALRPFPAGGLADRFRHPDQHERQRGHRQPRHRDAGRKAGFEGPRPSQRPRQSRPVVQRQLPDRHAHRGGAGAQRPPAAGASPPARGPRGQGRGVRGHRQDRPHPYAGRHAADAGTGILRICRPDRRRHLPRAGRPAGAVAIGARRNGRRHRAQYPGGVRRGVRLRSRRDHRHAVRRRRKHLRGAGGARRRGRSLRHAQCPRGIAQQDRQRHPVPRIRAAQRSRRTDAAGERTRFVDHAGQGQSRPNARR